MTYRLLLLLRALIAVLLFVPLAGCPTGEGSGGDDDDATSDDDDTPPTDDDDDDDDDDDTPTGPDGDACDTSDISADINAGGITGSNNGADNAVEGSCQIQPGGLDVVFQFTAPAAGTYFARTDNPGTDFDTKLMAFTDCDDPEGSEIGCNEDIDEQAEIYTSAMTFTVAATDDVVYLAVDGYDAQSVGTFELTLEFEDCGDGVVVGTEACDDGNEDSGDGCDETCQWECTDDDNEDDDGVLDATQLDETNLPASASGTVCPGDESDLDGVFLDVYRLDVLAEGAAVAASLTFGGTLITDCADFPLDFFLTDDLLNGYAEAQVGTGVCTTMAAVVDPGVYFLIITSDALTNPPADYTLEVDIQFPECGNNVLEVGEECDDDNTDPADGCSATCTTEECGNGTVDPDETCDDGNTDADDGCSDVCIEEEDATCDTVADLASSLDGANVTGVTAGETDDHTPSCLPSESADAVYEFVAAADAFIEVSTDHAGTDFDTGLSVRSDCGLQSTEIACNDDVDTAAGNYNSGLGFAVLSGETYYVIVDGYADGEGNFEMSVTTGTAPPAPECGDGEINGEDEECDDDNEVDGDGCENDCTWTTVCSFDAAQDWGTLVSGDNTLTLELTDPQNLPQLACSDSTDDQGTDAHETDGSATFTVETAGVYLFDIDYTGFDVQLELTTDDADCDTTRTCMDLFPNTAGALWYVLQPGAYRLAGEAWSDDLGGPVAITITAP